MSTKAKKTVMIFGISSFVGSNLAEYLKRDFKVVGTYHGFCVTIPGVLTIPCDVMTKEEVQLAIYALKPDITVYCVGLSSVQTCNDNPEMANVLNSNGLYNVSEYCQRYKSQLCYVSTSFVFGGAKRKYVEMDIPDPNTVYGRTKASAEFFIQKTSLNYLIFRCSQFYGRGINPHQLTWLELLQKNNSQSKNYVCDNFVHSGFIDVKYLGLLIKICIEKDLSNRLFQVSSEDIMTYYEFALKYSEIFNEKTSFISKGRWPFAEEDMPTNSYPSEEVYYHMDIGNVEGALNIQLPTIEESIKFTYGYYNGIEVGSGSKISKGEGVTYI